MQSFTIEEFKKIHQAWKESGLSVRDYCANTGIKESRYMIDYNPIENCVRLLPSVERTICSVETMMRLRKQPSCTL